MMRINILIFILTINFNSCKSQDLNLNRCDIKVDYRFSDKKAKDNKNVVLVLETGFDDYLKIYLDNKLIKEARFETDHEFGTAGEVVDFNYRNNKPPVFKIIFNDRCLEFKSLEDYRIIFLHKGDDKWIVEYRNSFNEYE